VLDDKYGPPVSAGDDSWSALAVEMCGQRQLETLLPAFASVQLDVVLLKASAFWGWLYRPGERAACDLDLLVRLGDRPRADIALETLGYTRTKNSKRSATERDFYQWIYVRRTRGMSLPVEMHTCLTHPSRYRYDLDQMFARAERISFAHTPALRLCAEDTLLHLAVHRTVHGFGFDEDLRNVVDTDRLIRAAEVDWPALADRARDWGCATTLWLLLSSARDAFRSPVPAETIHLLQPGRARATYIKVTLRRHHAAWVFRWPRMPCWARRLLIAPVALDRCDRLLASAARFAWMRIRDFWEVAMRRARATFAG
jgi:hypothetical protein